MLFFLVFYCCLFAPTLNDSTWRNQSYHGRCFSSRIQTRYAAHTSVASLDVLFSVLKILIHSFSGVLLKSILEMEEVRISSSW